MSPLVVAEACYLIGRHLGAEAEAAFLDASAPGQAFVLSDLVPADVARMAELVRQYGDLPLGGADASVIALAERLGVVEMATVDRRHFRVVRPRHADAFTLVPDLAGPGLPYTTLGDTTGPCRVFAVDSRIRPPLCALSRTQGEESRGSPLAGRNNENGLSPA